MSALATEKSSNPAVWAGVGAPEGYELAWKVVQPDGRTYGDFRWPFKGAVRCAAKDIVDTNRGPCPDRRGDGLCLAKTWRGAASGGITAITGLVVAYRLVDVLGESGEKLRVRGCMVLAVLDLQRLLREGNGSRADLSGAHLFGAHLSGADLSGAHLSGADLFGANLSGAHLSGADLSGADLFGANLSGAHLSRADLFGANLSRADLFGANLSGANLSRADLSRADLFGADLSGAHLSRADLFGANLSGAEGVPAGVVA